MAVFPVACNENHSLFIPPNVGGARGARTVTADRVNILRCWEGQTQRSASGDSQCWQTKKSNQIKQSGINYTKVRKIFSAFVIMPHSFHFFFCVWWTSYYYIESRELIEKSSIILKWLAICLKGTLLLPIHFHNRA